MDLREAKGAGTLRHPWEVARFDHFHRVLASSGLLSRPLRIVDVGAGDAWLAGQLHTAAPRGSEVVCCDANYSQSQREALAREQPELRFVATPPEEAFDLICLLDVLEHVEDDARFLQDLLARCARAPRSGDGPTGKNQENRETFVLVSVPAWMALFGRHDVFLHHHRRYAPAECRRLLQRRGLQIVRQGGLFPSLLLPRFAATLYEKLRAGTGRPLTGEPEGAAWHGGPLLTRVVAAELSIDNRLSFACASRGLALPGLSYWALCRLSSAAVG